MKLVDIKKQKHEKRKGPKSPKKDFGQYMIEESDIFV